MNRYVTTLSEKLKVIRREFAYLVRNYMNGLVVSVHNIKIINLKRIYFWGYLTVQYSYLRNMQCRPLKVVVEKKSKDYSKLSNVLASMLGFVKLIHMKRRGMNDYEACLDYYEGKPVCSIHTWISRAAMISTKNYLQPKMIFPHYLELPKK